MYNFLIYSCLGVFFGLLIFIGQLDKLFILNIFIINIILLIVYIKYKNHTYIRRIIKNIFILSLSIIMVCIYSNIQYPFLQENKLAENIKSEQLTNNTDDKDNINKGVFIVKKITHYDKYNQLIVYTADNKEYLIYNFTGDKRVVAGDIIEIEWKDRDNVIYPDIDKGQYKSYNSYLFAKSRNYENVILSKSVRIINDRHGFDNISTINKINININKYSAKINEYFLNNLSLLDNNYKGIVAAMVWGYEAELDNVTKTNYNNAGLSHTLVLSGFNIALLFSFCFILFKRFSFRIKLIASFIIMTIFMLIVSSNPPIIRAFIMMGYLLIAQFFFKEINSKFALWLSLFLFIIISPISIIYDVSLQLSVLATFAILYIYPEIKILYMKDKDTNPLTDIIILTLSINIILFPYLLFMFGQFNILSLILNVIATPIIPIIMILGIIISIFGNYLFFLIKIIVLLEEWLLAFINYLTKYSLLLEYRSIGVLELFMIYIIFFLLFNFLLFFNRTRAHIAKRK